MRHPCRLKQVALIVAAIYGFMSVGCGRNQSVQPGATTLKPGQTNLLPQIELPQPSQRLGTAVVILIDTSGSMEQKVRDQTGQSRSKSEIASAALRKIIGFTDAWQQRHPDSALFLGISSFSSITADVLVIEPFHTMRANQAVEMIPRPGGGTAIGRALAAGFYSLYSTGCVRKHLVCITDGDNTVGTPPDLIARQLYAQTHGDVEMHFVAFDTSARHFGFLKETGGTVFEAADEKQLQARLTEIYEKRIFAEAMPAEKQ